MAQRNPLYGSHMQCCQGAALMLLLSLRAGCCCIRDRVHRMMTPQSEAQQAWKHETYVCVCAWWRMQNSRQWPGTRCRTGVCFRSSVATGICVRTCDHKAPGGTSVWGPMACVFVCVRGALPNMCASQFIHNKKNVILFGVHACDSDIHPNGLANKPCMLDTRRRKA